MLKIHKKVIYMINKVIHGDCLDVLKELDDNSVDSVVTDPPYGLSKEPDINEVLSKWLAGEEYDHGHGGFMGKRDRKSTRLNSSHVAISYAVFCLQKKKNEQSM